MSANLSRRVAKLEAERGNSSAGWSVVLRQLRRRDRIVPTDSVLADQIAAAVHSGRARDRDDVVVLETTVVDPVTYRREHGLEPLDAATPSRKPAASEPLHEPDVEALAQQILASREEPPPSPASSQPFGRRTRPMFEPMRADELFLGMIRS